MIINYELIILILFITIINITIGLNNISKTDINYLSTNNITSNNNNNNNNFNNHNINNILYLNLSNKNLNNTNIINLNKLINLEILDLSLNNIKYFNFNFNKIKYLNLYNNNLISFNNNLIKKKIVFINLACNKIENINSLKLFGNNLEIVNLSFNFITTLINTNNKLFFNIKNLKILNLSNNKINNLVYNSTSNDSVFYNLVSLEVLDLSSNNITVINNKTFIKLFNLKTLDLSYNNLARESLKAIQLIPNLIELSLAYNNELGSSLQGFVTSWNLKEFDASGTGLKKIPYALTQSVRTLRLNNNVFENIQCGDLDSYPLLQILQLAACNITKIEDDAFGRLEILQELHLNDNHLISIPISLPSNIEYLYLQYNNIINIDGYLLQQLLKLKLLNLEGNHILYLPELPKLTTLFYINLNLNKLKGINLNLLNNLPNLKELNVNNNPIKCSDLNQIAEWVLPCRNILLNSNNNNNTNNNDLYSLDNDGGTPVMIRSNGMIINTITKHKCINYNEKSIDTDDKIASYLKFNRVLHSTKHHDNQSNLTTSYLTTSTTTTPTTPIYTLFTSNRSNNLNVSIIENEKFTKIESRTKLKPDTSEKQTNNINNHINGSDIVNMHSKASNYKNSNNNNIKTESKPDTKNSLKTIKKFKIHLNTRTSNSNKINNLLDIDKIIENNHKVIKNNQKSSSNNNYNILSDNNNNNSNDYYYHHHSKINTEKLNLTNQTSYVNNSNNNSFISNDSNATSYSTHPEKWNEVRNPQSTRRPSFTFIIIGATIGIILSICLIQIYRCIKPSSNQQQTLHHHNSIHHSIFCNQNSISNNIELPSSIILNHNRYNFNNYNNDDEQYNPVRRDFLPMERLNLSSSTSYLQSHTNIFDYW